MNDVNKFLNPIEKSSSIIDRILNHPYLSALENGKIPKEKIQSICLRTILHHFKMIEVTLK